MDEKDDDQDWRKFIESFNLQDVTPRFIYDMAWSAGHNVGMDDAERPDPT
jgi:hypothetical protein